jgi:hypothetical protein
MRPIRLAPALALILSTALFAADAKKSHYKGWESLELNNGLVEVQVVPDIGGRVIQLKLGDFEYLWVNPQLAGKKPTASGLGPNDSWLNYGGDKLWPAPQGWDNDRQWPGPPDAVLDGSPHQAAILASSGKEAKVQLVSRDDPRSGIRFSRVAKVFDDAARVSFDSTMTNIDTKPRRWGIWQVTQLNAADRSGRAYNKDIRCYSPINPASRYEKGYVEQYGLVNNPSFSADRLRGLVIANYQRLVGKIGMDNSAGWVATVDGTAGYVFVERFTCYPGKRYPDNASAEFWMNGAGQIVCGGKIVDCKDDPIETPPYVENEILSPFAQLKPGESYSFHLDWFAAKIGGDYPILNCTEVGVTCEPLTATVAGNAVHIAGRFGVFYPGKAALALLDPNGVECGKMPLDQRVSPNQPLVLKRDVTLPAQAATVCLIICDADGKPIGELARTRVQR